MVGREEGVILIYNGVVSKLAWIFKIKPKIFKEIPCLQLIASSHWPLTPGGPHMKNIRLDISSEIFSEEIWLLLPLPLLLRLPVLTAITVTATATFTINTNDRRSLFLSLCFFKLETPQDSGELGLLLSCAELWKYGASSDFPPQNSSRSERIMAKNH